MFTDEMLKEIVDKREAKRIEDIKKESLESLEKLKLTMLARIALGVGLPEKEVMIKYGTWYMTEMSKDVKNKEDFHIIKKVVGALEKYGIEPVRGKRKMVQIQLRPKNPLYSGFSFYYQRKLLPSDKCKIVTEVYRTRKVVCGVKS